MTSSQKKIQEAAAQSGGLPDGVFEAIIDSSHCFNDWLDSIKLAPENDHNTHVMKLLLAFEICFRQVGFDGDNFVNACNEFQQAIMKCSPDKNAKQIVIDLENAA